MCVMICMWGRGGGFRSRAGPQQGAGRRPSAHCAGLQRRAALPRRRAALYSRAAAARDPSPPALTRCGNHRYGTCGIAKQGRGRLSDPGGAGAAAAGLKLPPRGGSWRHAPRAQARCPGLRASCSQWGVLLVGWEAALLCWWPLQAGGREQRRAGRRAAVARAPPPGAQASKRWGGHHSGQPAGPCWLAPASWVLWGPGAHGPPVYPTMLAPRRLHVPACPAPNASGPPPGPAAAPGVGPAGPLVTWAGRAPIPRLLQAPGGLGAPCRAGGP